MKKLVLTLAFAGSVCHLLANSTVGVEKMALHHVAIGYGAFKAVNNGKLPENWKDIGTVMSLGPNSAGLERQHGYRIEDRYEILQTPIPYIGEEDGRIIMIRVLPLKGFIGNIVGLYRYAVMETKTGEIRDFYESESNLSIAFKKVGFELPKYDNLPAVETEMPMVDDGLTPTMTRKDNISPIGSHSVANPLEPSSSQDMKVRTSRFSHLTIVISVAVCVIGIVVVFLRARSRKG